jgi:hypothetical protein
MADYAAPATDDASGAAGRALRSALHGSAEQASLFRELVRCATLAANGHNTQPAISLRPGSSRRTPAVDPADDHHLLYSLRRALADVIV